MTTSDTEFQPDHEASADAMAGAHMSTFRVADEDAEDMDSEFIQVDPEGQDIETPSEASQMPREAFRAVWQTAWNIPGMMLADYRPLMITDEKQASCDEAADALYDLAEMHFPWLLNEQNSTVGAVARMLPFAMVQAGAFRSVMVEKRKARLEAANANKAPADFKSSRSPTKVVEQPEPQINPQAPGPFDWMDAEGKAA